MFEKANVYLEKNIPGANAPGVELPVYRHGSHALTDPDNEIAICYVQHVRGCSFACNELFPTLRELIYEERGF